MKLYVVRHGETAWNAMKRLQGANDIPLNEKGLEQARAAKEKLASYDYDLIFSSPYQRAAMTARVINEDRKAPIFYDVRLRERSFGVNEGKVRGEYDYSAVWDYEQNLSFGGESVQVFFARINEFLDDLKKAFPDKTVLLVCHGGTMRGIECYFNGIKKPAELAAFFSQNTEVRTYEC